jgi:predicted PurR-regulated permease PerM
MKRDHIFSILILFFAALFFYLFYRILAPFLEPILWTIFIAIVSYPVYTKLRRSMKERGILSAVVMTALVVFIFVLPVRDSSLWHDRADRRALGCNALHHPH